MSKFTLTAFPVAQLCTSSHLGVVLFSGPLCVPACPHPLTRDAVPLAAYLPRLSGGVGIYVNTHRHPLLLCPQGGLGHRVATALNHIFCVGHDSPATELDA